MEEAVVGSGEFLASTPISISVELKRIMMSVYSFAEAIDVLCQLLAETHLARYRTARTDQILSFPLFFLAQDECTWLFLP